MTEAGTSGDTVDSNTGFDLETVDRGDGRTPDAGDGAENTGEERPDRTLPLDTVFTLLKNERRRITLDYLIEVGEPVRIGELAEHVAAVENETTVRMLSSTERKRAYVGLYQCHLPKMDGADVVEYNQDRGIVEVGPNVDQLVLYLDDPDEETDWTTYYRATTVGVAVLNLGALLGSTVVPVPWPWVTAVTLVTLFAVAAWHRSGNHTGATTDDASGEEPGTDRPSTAD